LPPLPHRDSAPRLHAGHSIDFGAFLKLGIVVMPPALILAIGAALLVG